MFGLTLHDTVKHIFQYSVITIPTVVYEILQKYWLGAKYMAEKIGIFKGRSAQYNKLILQVLTEAFSEGKELKEWELAKRIQKKLDNGGNWYVQAQRIYSILIRKNGRLHDLEQKHYISHDVKTEDGRKVRYWTVTSKGLVAALILYPTLIESVVNRIRKDKEFKKGLNKGIKKFRKTLQRGHQPIKFASKPLKKAASQLFNWIWDRKELQELIDDIKLLIENGFQLDIMDENDFYLMLHMAPKIKEMRKKLAKTLGIKLQHHSGKSKS